MGAAQATQTVERVGKRIAEASGLKGCKWEFIVVKDDSMNAFVLPGGKVSQRNESNNIKVGKAPRSLCRPKAHLSSLSGVSSVHYEALRLCNFPGMILWRSSPVLFHVVVVISYFFLNGSLRGSRHQPCILRSAKCLLVGLKARLPGVIVL